jgi:tetratricopeptide (TPR) repeat protein
MNLEKAEDIFNEIKNKGIDRTSGFMAEILSVINCFNDEIEKYTTNDEKIFVLWYRVAYLTGIIIPVYVFKNTGYTDSASVIELKLKTINNLKTVMDNIDSLDIGIQQDIQELYFNLCINTADELISKRHTLMTSIEICEGMFTYFSILRNICISADIKEKIRRLAEKYIDNDTADEIEKKYKTLGKEKARIYYEKTISLLWKLSDYKNGFFNPSQGYYNMAKKYRKKKCFEESLKYINFAIQKEPTNYKYYLFRGYIYRKMDNIENAKRDYINAINSDKKNIDIESLYSLGTIYNETKEFKQAIHCFNKILDKYPNDVQTNYVIGISYRNTGDNDLAILHYNKALQNDPDYTKALIHRAQVYLKQYRIQEAIIDCNTVIKKKKNDAIAYETMGLAYAIIDNYEKAHFMFNKALEINPNNIETRKTITKLEQKGTSYFHNLNFIDGDIISELDETELALTVKSSTIEGQKPIKYYVDFIIRDILRKEVDTIKTNISQDIEPYAIVIACNHIDKKQYTEAIDILKGVKNEFSYRIDIYFHLGLAYLKRAVQYLLKEEMLLSDEKQITERLNENEIHYHEDTVMAINCFNDIIYNKETETEIEKYYTNDVYYYRMLASCFWGEHYFFTKKYFLAYQNIKKNDNHIKNGIYNNKKSDIETKQDYSKLITNYKEKIQNTSFDIDMMGTLGHIYMMLGNYKEALNILSQIIDVIIIYDYVYSDIYDPKELGNLYKIDVIKMFLEHKNITDELFDYYLCLRSKANYSLGRIDTAIIDCEEAINKNKDNPYANRLLECYNMKGSANGIIIEILYDGSENNDFSSWEEKYSQGLDNAKNSKFQDAIGNFTSVIICKPEYADAYRARAFAYLGIKDKESALAGFKETNQINKKDLIAMRWISKLLCDNGINTDITELFKNNQV